jgi:hypothetical protein
MRIFILKRFIRFTLTGFLLLSINAFIGCTRTDTNKTKISSNTKPMFPTNEDFNISLIKLIANPEKYNGKTIRVKGYLNLEFEGNALYFHKEDYDKGMNKNSIWIDIPKEIHEKATFQNCSKQYVIIEGKFDMNNNGHMSMFSGAITKITRLEMLK